MPLSPGTKLGVYEVTAKIGAGGMGEVYRAHDTSLDRDVAIKVLPDAFATDPERLARFEREAKVLASLNHSNIAAIYGLEKSGDTRALASSSSKGRRCRRCSPPPPHLACGHPLPRRGRGTKESRPVCSCQWPGHPTAGRSRTSPAQPMASPSGRCRSTGLVANPGCEITAIPNLFLPGRGVFIRCDRFGPPWTGWNIGSDVNVENDRGAVCS